MESVTVYPQFDTDDDGNPVPGGSPVVLEAFAVAPGNTTVLFGDSGSLDSADFTVYLSLDAAVNDGDLIEVRGRTCRARVQEWRDPWPGTPPLDGMVVLCKSATGASGG